MTNQHINEHKLMQKYQVFPKIKYQTNIAYYTHRNTEKYIQVKKLDAVKENAVVSFTLIIFVLQITS